jgi:UDP-glucuronate 4-epimerase
VAGFSTLTSRRYLLTGCAGFIASRVADLLLGAGHDVTGIDNLNDAYDPRLKSWRLAQLAGRDGFRFFQADITDKVTLEALFVSAAANDDSRPPFDAVLNLAARAGVRPSVTNPWLYVDVNTMGCLNLLDLCRHYGVAKFVQASTSSVYGDQTAIPFRENADTSRPLSPYAASKKAAETLAYTYHQLHGLDVTVLRYFTVYGPAGRPDMAVFRFVRDIREAQPIIVFGDGTQRRDFTYVDDIARGTIAALRPLGYEIINLGGDHPVQLAAMIDQLGRLLGCPAQITHRPPHPADVPATWADISKAAHLLDWRPQTDLQSGLERAVDWYESHRDWAKTLDPGT